MPVFGNISKILKATLWLATLGVVVLFSAGRASAQAQDSLHLDQVVQDVVHHNSRAVAARYMEEATRAKVGPAGAWDDPILMLGIANLPTSLDFGIEPMTMKMIGLSQNIPYAGQKGLQAKAAKAEADAVREERYGTEVNLVMAARYAFADLYYRAKSLNDLVAQYSLLEEVVTSTKAKQATNQANQDEVLNAQADLWRIQTQLLDAEQMVDEARYELNILRGLDPTAEMPPLASLRPPEIPATPDGWLAAARSNYRPLRKLSYQSEAFGYSGDASRRMSWPMLGLSASYAFRADTEMDKRDNMIGIQANISLPFFSGRKQKKMSESMQAMRKGVDEEAIQMGREIEARLRLLHTTALHLEQSINIYQQRVIPAAEDAFKSALAGYSTNQIPYTSVLMYATGIFRDRIALNEFGDRLARTMAEIDSYTVDPTSFTAGLLSRNSNQR